MFLSEPTDLCGPRGKQNPLTFSYFGCSSGVHAVELHVAVVVWQGESQPDSMLEAVSVTCDLLFLFLLL